MIFIAIHIVKLDVYSLVIEDLTQAQMQWMKE